MTAPTPALPSFTDGTVLTDTALTALAGNVANLHTYGMGSFQQERPICVVRVTRKNREIPSTTDSFVFWDEAEIDTDRMWSGQYSESMIINTAGLYRVGMQLAFQPAVVANTGLIVACRLSTTNTGSSDSFAVGFGPYINSNGGSSFCSALVPLNAGQRIFGYVNQNSGATQSLDPDYGTRMYAAWMGPIP